jgi:thiamine monophosphate kinase
MEASHASAFAKEAEEHKVTVTEIGKVEPGNSQVTVLDGKQRPLALDHTGFTHF